MQRQRQRGLEPGGGATIVPGGSGDKTDPGLFSQMQLFAFSSKLLNLLL